ncbi:hypothetical protein [Ureibacillus manganicus]|uniref:Uncharacterized protein n=1 Tax=Ureibacillus manganicus DSM 26584 TaxID=1384049 RepID=A0A0A3IW24_9BACL|nr:hypothetical protein [Ureibacillus manganicus]KGR79027.1 hypothetical protein CD29_08425 [Ureibacillus manganicus DSM 26584]
MNKNSISNIFLFIGSILLLLKIVFSMGYLNELRVEYGTYVEISYMACFFIGVVLKSISNKEKKNKN